jgi:hypothetical protein
MDETGKLLTETRDDVTMPADLSFETVNDFVHGSDVQYEELQWLCLGMSNEIDRLKQPNAYISAKTAELLLRGGSACDVLFTPDKTERNTIGIVILR